MSPGLSGEELRAHVIKADVINVIKLLGMGGYLPDLRRAPK